MLEMSSQQPASLQISLDSHDDRQIITHFNFKGDILQLPLYTTQDKYISGHIKVNPPKDSKFDCSFLQIELIGETRINHIKEKSTYKFLHLTKILIKNQSIRENGPIYHFSFSIDNLEKDYESYNGISASTRYYLKAVLEKKNGGQVTEEQEFLFQIPVMTPVAPNPMSLQLRIADCLVLKVDFGKRDFYMDEYVVGKITVEKNAIEIERVEMHLIKKEVINFSDSSQITNEDLIVKQDIYKGDPQTGDILPFKLYLGTQNLDPCLQDHHPKYLIKYVLMLSFVDSEDRSLFKQIGINILRRK